MAVEDPTAKLGLKLTIKDYPFASDGLILRDAIMTMWTSTTQKQAWWSPTRNFNHGGPRLGLKAMKTRMNHGGLS
jgi:lipoxygenase